MTASTTATTTDTRAEATQTLISAGRTLFTERGYRQTGFTDLAAAAGLEPGYARELLPDKAAVFGALVERTVRVAGLLGPALAEGVDEDLPARLARTFLALWEPGEDGESPLIEVFRVALSDREASAVWRERITEVLNGSVDQELPGEDAVLRTALFGAQLGGTVVARHLTGTAAVASVEIETVIETITPALRRTLLGSADAR
ncbi:TetR family transcriptional regulator [Streptomyces sp. NPDC047081]|uniref:TetR/AcrR family transcriptional regulator n=1 Tax=Streptomyces sp. NPDC047081 TaxID=3154706 RepID=UPI0033FEE520